MPICLFPCLVLAKATTLKVLCHLDGAPPRLTRNVDQSRQLLVALAPSMPSEEGIVHRRYTYTRCENSRALKYNGITSVVLTTSYCDLFADPGLFTKSLSENPERNRRAIAPIMLLAGAVAGGLFANSRFGLEGSYWTAAGIKFLIVITWAFWKTDNESEED